MASQAALANAGNIAGKPASPAKRAKRVMPIIGEIRTRRSGRASCGSSMASSAYLSASAPPLENPTRCSGDDGAVRRRASLTASRVAADQSSHSTSVSARRHGAVRRQPDHDRDKAERRDSARAMWRWLYGESVSPCSSTTAPTGAPSGSSTYERLKSCEKCAGIDRAAVEIPVDRDTVFRIELLRDLGPKGLEDPGFLGEISAPIGSIELLAFNLARHVGVPRLERRTALRIVNTHYEQRHHDDRQQDQPPFHALGDLGAHAPPRCVSAVLRLRPLSGYRTNRPASGMLRADGRYGNGGRRKRPARSLGRRDGTGGLGQARGLGKRGELLLRVAVRLDHAGRHDQLGGGLHRDVEFEMMPLRAT